MNPQKMANLQTRMGCYQNELKSMFVLGLALAITTLSGCSKFDSSINPSSLCEVTSWDREAAAQACKPGQKVVFLPNRWGNEQIPIMFAAINCDPRYPAVQNNGGVICIYLPTTFEVQKQAPAVGK
jgi:hypothetical protein